MPIRSQGVQRAADHIYLQTGSSRVLKMVGRLFGYRDDVSSLIGTDEVV